MSDGSKIVKDRKSIFDEIISLDKPHIIVTGGPGTGKTYLFKQIINEKKKKGKSKFLAITFVGKLRDVLADELAGLAKTKTLHGFAREFVLSELGKASGGWIYYPDVMNIIKEDLELKRIKNIKIGGGNYKSRTKYYKTVGKNDVVHYAVQICKKDDKKIPKYDLILIDEYQDFSKIEAEFVDLLAEKNDILIVGDDDQALFAFRGALSKFIREKFDKSNTKFEKRKLKYSFRCTEVIVDAFHNVIDYFELNKKDNKRIEKEFICYFPKKKDDNKLNSQIIVWEDQPEGTIHTKITSELKKLLNSQKIKSVLIIGEAQTYKISLNRVAFRLKELGFQNVSSSSNENRVLLLNQQIIDAYKFLVKDKNNYLAWRLLINELDSEEKNKLILGSFEKQGVFVKNIPGKFKDEHLKMAGTLEYILDNPKSRRNKIANNLVKELEEQIAIEKKKEREILINQLISENKHLPRPLVNLNITVCSILKAKGLGADVVFLIGFDQGKFPMKKIPTKHEIYQMLVALTRAKKRLYLVNTKKPISKFIEAIGKKTWVKN